MTGKLVVFNIWILFDKEETEQSLTKVLSLSSDKDYIFSC